MPDEVPSIPPSPSSGHSQPFEPYTGPAWLTLVEVIVPSICLLAHNWDWWHLTTGALKGSPDTARFLPIIIMTVVVLFSFWRVRQSTTSMGLRPHQWRSGWVGLGVFTVIGVAVLVACGFWAGPAARRVLMSSWLVQYVPGMLAQQWAIQCYFNNRIYFAMASMPQPRRRWTAIISSTIAFGVFHLPNYPLTTLVVLSSGFWTWHFRKYRNFPALCVSHLILGTTAMYLLGNGPLQNLRVGLHVLK